MGLLMIMGDKSFQFICFLIATLCILTIATAGNAKVRCIESERRALLNFKQGIQDHENLFTSWGSKEEEDCCRWRGIQCDNQTSHVIKLDLHIPVALTGHSRSTPDETVGLVYDHTILASKISPSLLNLPHLQHLDLSYNDFGNARIPEFIGLLTRLTHLNLKACTLGGNIPHQLGNLSSLCYLDLSFNYFNVDSLQWLPRLSSLRNFSLSHSNLTRAMDWFPAIQKLPHLSSLELLACQFPEIPIPSSVSYVSSSSKSVARVHLRRNNFKSSIFSWLFNITSSQQLVELDLSYNQLEGQIPDSLGYMTSLQHLDLSYNQLEGQIPDYLGYMISLEYLDLSGNQLEGAIPKSLGKLCNLQTLDLSQNNLSGQLADILQNLAHGCTKDSLEILVLRGNQLTGSSLDITAFSSLREIYLDDNRLKWPFLKSIDSKLDILSLGGNQLTMSFLASLGQLSNLRVLNISSTTLSGFVSEAHLWNFSKLQQLDFSFNSLTLTLKPDSVPPFQLDTIKLCSCKLGPLFPNWLQTQKNVTYLDISNSGISDIIPHWFWINLSSKLRYLNLSSNHIRSQLPNTLPLKFDYFPALDLSSNLFHGHIPSFLSSTTVLKLSQNNLSGSISFLCTIVNTSAMSYLDLSHNQISGSLPDCWMHFKWLRILNLENNNISGVIPTSMGSLHQIQSLRLRGNHLSGELPSSLKNCKWLEVVDLGENDFFGEIPPWIGESLTELLLLRLRSNKFNGSIPLTICQLTSLIILDISSNNISGRIPPCLNNFTAMSQIQSPLATITYDYAYSLKDLHANFYIAHFVDHSDNAFVMWKGMEREYGTSILGLLKLIDLSSNKLTGEIPSQVTSLLGLKTLNLSTNCLTGIIPQNIIQLQALEALDLSKNRLHGEVPQGLAHISYLSNLDLSNNMFSGRIPTGPQLQGFNASAFIGNLQLCGPPLKTKCPEEDASNSNGASHSGEKLQEDDGEWYGTQWPYVSVGLGFAFGFMGVCGTLVLNTSWRHAYFQSRIDIWEWFDMMYRIRIYGRTTRWLQNCAKG